MTVQISTTVFAVLLAISLWAGGCSRSDSAEDNITHIESAEQFDRTVLGAQTPVLVDFYADWCLPCKELAPILAKLAAEYKGRASFVRVDTDKLRDLALRHGVFGLPTVVVFAGGAETKWLPGLREAAEYRQALDAALAKLVAPQETGHDTQ